MTRAAILTRKDTDVGVGTFDSIAWAYECHVLAPDNKAHRNAILYRSEDCPDRIDFYLDRRLTIQSKVAYRWTPARNAETTKD